MAVATVPPEIAAFLRVETPNEWLHAANDRLPELLIDHANCELKAASTALGFIYRYPSHTDLAWQMSRLAREELRHFEQVRKILVAMDIDFEPISASRYAGALRSEVREQEPDRLVDMLIVGALIEARSCERFAALIPQLPKDLARFYEGLLASEARHFERYLDFARAACDGEDFEARVDALRDIEAALITKPDSQFRFHSGLPANAA